MIRPGERLVHFIPILIALALAGWFGVMGVRVTAGDDSPKDREAALRNLFETMAEQGSVEAWTWTEEEAQRVEKLEKRVRRQGKMFTLTLFEWRVESDISARFCAELGHFLELYGKLYGRVFTAPAPRVVKQRMTVVVYANRDDYTKRFSDGSRGQAAWKAVNDRFSEYHVYTFARGDHDRKFERFYRPILQHEAAHLLLRRSFGTRTLPAWFDEGHASYIEAFDARAEEKSQASTRRERSWRLRWLRSQGIEAAPDLRSFLKLRSVRQFNPDGFGRVGNLHYAISELWIEFLMSSEQTRRYYKTIFLRVREGRETILNDEELAEIEPLWKAWLEAFFERKAAAPLETSKPEEEAPKPESCGAPAAG